MCWSENGDGDVLLNFAYRKCEWDIGETGGGYIVVVTVRTRCEWFNFRECDEYAVLKDVSSEMRCLQHLCKANNSVMKSCLKPERK